MGVIFTALLVMALTMLSSFAAVGFSRQRSEATALADQSLEQMRALPANLLFMSSSDLGSDTQVVPAGCAAAGITCSFNSREVPVANFGASPPTGPLVPHIATRTALPGNTVYTIASYISYDPLDSTKQTLIATVQVKWSSPQKGGVKPNLQVESKIYNGKFSDAGPGIHTFTATAQGTPGGILVSGTLLNRSLANLAMNFPSVNAGLSGTSLPGTTDVGKAGNPVSASVSADTISAATLALVSTGAASASAQSLAGAVPAVSPVGTQTANPTVLNLPASQGLNVGSLTGNFAAGASNKTEAIAATSADGRVTIPTGGGNMPNTPQLGYGRSVATQSGIISADLSLLGAVNIGLVSATPTGNSAPGPDMATVQQNGTATTPFAQTVTASAQKALTELDVLTILGNPTVKLTGFKAAATSCAAGPANPGGCTGTPAPTNAGQLVIAGLLNIPLAGATPATITIPSINLNTGLVNIQATGSVTIGATPSTTGNTATVPSPVTVNVHLVVSLLVGLVTLTDLNISVNLGTITTSASYS
jgi:hypothetical protein